MGLTRLALPFQVSSFIPGSCGCFDLDKVGSTDSSNTEISETDEAGLDPAGNGAAFPIFTLDYLCGEIRKEIANTARPGLAVLLHFAFLSSPPEIAP